MSQSIETTHPPEVTAAAGVSRDAKGAPEGRPTPPTEKRVALWDQAKFALVRGFLYAWARLFSLKGLYLLGQGFGTLEYWINFKRRARYRRELQKVFPDRLTPTRERAIIRRYFRRTRCDKLFYLIFDKLPREKLLKRIRFHGREHLDAGLARENGVYVMISHNGSHHVAGLIMSLLGYKVAGVRDRNEGPLRRYIQEKYIKTFPEIAALRVLYADSFPRDIYRCFDENRVVASALDVSRIRGMNLKTCPVQFLGETREFLTGTLQVALRSDAAICQGFVVSRKNFYFRLILTPPLHDPETADTGRENRDELVQTIMQKYADGIAEHIRKHPDHLSRA